MIPIERLIGRISPERLTPQSLGERTYEVFNGYDRNGQPSEQLSFLLRHKLVFSSTSGYPIYRLPSPEDAEGMTKPWEKTRISSWETTEISKNHSAESPQMYPFDVNEAYNVVTITNRHHMWQQPPYGENDILITRNMAGNRINTFWYRKGETPVRPRVMIDVHTIANFLAYDPNYAYPNIQMWKLVPMEGTYQLQADLNVNSLSLRNFLLVLKTAPADLQKIEAAAR